MDKLTAIVKVSGLTGDKAEIILAQFRDFHNIAAEWEKRAQLIKVTNASQTDDMALAKTGRLLLRAKRNSIEKTRKFLKEDYIKGGRAVDQVANFLKELIAPTEKYLEAQEKWIEIEAKKMVEAAERSLIEKAEKERIAFDDRTRREAIAKQNAYQEEMNRKQVENEKLRQEAREREKEIQKERQAARKKAFDIQEAERKKREEIERKAGKERKKLEVKIQKKHTCPNCGHKF